MLFFDCMMKSFFNGPFIQGSYKIFIKNVTGLENIPRRGGFVLSSNHNSYLDVILLNAIFMFKKKLNIRFIAKKELFNNWLFKRMRIVFNPILIDTQKKGKKALPQAIRALKNGDIIVIYPEGTRSLTGKIQRGKTGVARLALWARVPVVPVGIKGTFELMPMGKIIPKFKKSVVFNIGKPLYFDKYYKRKITNKLLRSVTDIVMKEIARLSKQKYNF